MKKSTVEYLGPEIREILSATEILITCGAINHFGDELHPYADIANLAYFEKDYVIKCIATALPKFTTFGRSFAKSALIKIIAK